MKVLFFALLFTYGFHAYGDDHTSCLLIQSDAKAFKSLESNGDMIILPEGILVPVLEQSADERYYKVAYYNKEYWIEKEKHRRGSKRLCTLYPKCLTLSKNAKFFAKPDSKTAVVRTAKKNTQIDWFGERKITAKDPDVKEKITWYLVSTGDRYAWTKAENGNLDSKACSESVFQTKRKWFFNAEAAMQANAPSESYNTILTNITDPNDVACAQDPLFTGIKKGTGQRFGVQTSHNFNSWLTLRVGVMYEQIKYRLSFLNNPHPDPGNTNCNLITVGVNDLTSGADTITENNVVVPIGAFYRWEMGRNHSLLFGGDVNPTMTLTSGYSYKFFTGQTLSKQTENNATITPDKFKFTNNLEIRYIYQFPYTKEEYFGVSVFGKMGFTGEYLIGLGLYL